MLKKSAVIFFFSCIGSVHFAWSQLATFTTDTLIYKAIPEVTVSGILATNLNLPFQIVDKAFIQTRSFVTPSDALQQVPGISISRDGSWPTSVNIRGFDESKLLLLSEGDRLQTASDIAGVLSTFDLLSVERIEVIKGAGSVLYGTGAIGGVVNFVPLRPGYTPDLQANGQISSGFHTANQMFTNHARVSLTNSNWYLGLTGSIRHAQNTTTPLGEMENSQFNDASFSLTGGMTYGDNQELIVHYTHFNAWDVGLPGGSAFPPNAKVRYTQFERNHLSGEYRFTNLSPTLQLLSVRAYSQQISRKVENIVSPRVAIFPSSSNINSGIRALANVYIDDDHSATVGAELRHREQLTSRTRITTFIDTVFTGEQPTPEVSVMDAGVFCQYKWVLVPQRLTFNTGVRIDVIQTHNDTAFREVSRFMFVNGKRVNLPYNSTVLFQENSTREWAYALHADLVFQPHKQHTLIFSLANAHRAASLEERFKFIDQLGTLRVGNPLLRPENGIFANFCYRKNGESLQLKVEMYANYMFQLISEEMGQFAFPSGQMVPAWRYVNVDRALYKGAEMELNWLVMDALSLNAFVSYVQGVNQRTDNPMPLVPPLRGAASIQYSLWRLMEVTAAVNWEYSTKENINQDAEKHQFAVLSMFLETEPKRIGRAGLQLFAGVHNLFNTAYQSYLSTLRGVNRLESGRNFFARAILNW